ncbi:MAG TPA: ATP-dependent DNA ligase [Thermoleophilia bacterium]|nr:ATP-dependent DNA ligase [Thermoleophilia bacterium]
MDLPVAPPVAPMLARAVEDIPHGDLSYEPKWDGFRAIVFRDRDEVEIGSRNERPMNRYFPELLAAIKRGLPERCVVDGEIVVPDPSQGRLDFEALQQRIHPAESRVNLLAQQTPAHLVAFDLLALGDRDLTAEPFRERRRLLEEVMADVGTDSTIHLTPATRDPKVAQQWFEEFEGAGLDGVVAKPLELTYQPDRRVMFKIKHIRTADCVVAGYRTYKRDTSGIGSLLLGLYDDADLVFVGVVGAFAAARRRELFQEFQPLVTTFDGHPWDWGEEIEATTRTPTSSAVSRWSAGKDLTFVPLRPERVVEVRYDHMEGTRFRHTTQFVRWRDDREPRSCTFDQLEEPVGFDLADVLR